VKAGESPLSWKLDSLPMLEAVSSVMSSENYFGKLASLWGQESNRNGNTADLRRDHVIFIKALGLILFRSVDAADV
jgi:proteasome activator subunit 4